MTVVSSKTREVHIDYDRPFCIIGERINPTGRKRLAEEMRRGDYSRVERDAVAQIKAGAQILDVNAGIPLADEPEILSDCIRLLQSITDVPLSIDSSIVDALAAGLSAYEGKALVNSVTGEEKRLEAVLPLVLGFSGIFSKSAGIWRLMISPLRLSTAPYTLKSPLPVGDSAISQAGFH